MKLFNPNDYANKSIAFRCEKLSEAIELLSILHSRGFVWLSGNSLAEFTNWDDYGAETCYDISSKYVEYGDASYYDEIGYTIIDWKDIPSDEIIELSDKEWSDILLAAKEGNPID